MATEDQIVLSALDILSGIGTGQPPAPEDKAKVQPLLGPTLDYINRLKLAYFVDAGDVPDEAIQPVATILATWDSLIKHFNADVGPQERALAERQLLLLNASAPSYLPLRATYF